MGFDRLLIKLGSSRRHFNCQPRLSKICLVIGDVSSDFPADNQLRLITNWEAEFHNRLFTGDSNRTICCTKGGPSFSKLSFRFCKENTSRFSKIPSNLYNHTCMINCDNLVIGIEDSKVHRFWRIRKKQMTRRYTLNHFLHS